MSLSIPCMRDITYNCSQDAAAYAQDSSCRLVLCSCRPAAGLSRMQKDYSSIDACRQQQHNETGLRYRSITAGTFPSSFC